MPERLTSEFTAAHGVHANHERMDNGELRFRLAFADGTSLIRTEGSETPAWQNSHTHRSVYELNVVQSGAALYAELLPDGLHTRVYRAGEHFLSRPGIPHNGYFSPGAVVLTVKYGDIAPGDWYPAPELDGLCCQIDAPSLLDL